ANGSPRGLALRTNTGFDINRAYYNMMGADDVAADRSIRYVQRDDDQQRQQILAAGQEPRPGRVQVDQVPDGLMVPTPDTAAPVLQDLTPDEIDPSSDFVIEVVATDDTQVRTVTLMLSNDVDGTTSTLNLQRDLSETDTYRHTITAADLMG